MDVIDFEDAQYTSISSDYWKEVALFDQGRIIRKIG